MQDLISSQSAMGCNMSLTRLFLHFHLDVFLKIWQPSPRDMAKNFNQDISQIEKVYSGKWIPDILAEY